MKKINNTANAISNDVIGRAANRTSKAFFFLFIITVLFFSSCARQNASGCGAWICKSNMKNVNERKYVKHISNMYKCPTAVASNSK
ncbi:MAG: hypothetical protein R2807_04965 [Chitinophagales bacterium]